MSIKKLLNIGIDLELILCCDLCPQKGQRNAWYGFISHYRCLTRLLPVSISFVNETMELALFYFEYNGMCTGLDSPLIRG